MLRVLACVSGGGTNLQALIDRIEDGTIKGAEIVKVISNNPGVFALERAEKHGIEGCVVSPKNFDSRAEFNEALLKAVDEAKPDLIVLAGFLVVIPPKMIEKYSGKIIKTDTWINIDVGTGYGYSPILLRFDDMKEFMVFPRLT